MAEIKKELTVQRRYADTTELMVKINEIISSHIETENMVAEAKSFDISKINFELLKIEFAKVKHKFTVMRELMLVAEETLQRMMAVNPERINYYETYQKIIEEYNRSQDKAEIEKIFNELMKLVEELEQEEVRYVREGFTNDEELAIFDKLVADKENLSKEDIKKIKGLAVDVLRKIKDNIANTSNWRDKEETRAKMLKIIDDDLYENLPEAYNDNLQDYTNLIYEFVYHRYPGAV